MPDTTVWTAQCLKHVFFVGVVLWVCPWRVRCLSVGAVGVSSGGLHSHTAGHSSFMGHAMDGSYASNPYVYGAVGYYPGDESGMYYDGGDGMGGGGYQGAYGATGGHLAAGAMHGYHPGQVGMAMAAPGYGSWMDARGGMMGPGMHVQAQQPPQQPHDGSTASGGTTSWEGLRYTSDMEFAPQSSQALHSRQFAQSLGNTCCKC